MRSGSGRYVCQLQLQLYSLQIAGCLLGGRLFCDGFRIVLLSMPGMIGLDDVDQRERRSSVLCKLLGNRNGCFC